MDFELIQSAVPLLLKGLSATLEITFFGILVGFPFGLGFALARMSSNRALSAAARTYSMIFRGTPLLVQIFIIYYGLGQLRILRDYDLLWWFLSDGMRCAILAVVLNTAAYTSEILRGGLMSIAHGELEAARACGMSNWVRFRRIRFPLAIRQALPAYGNEITIIIKESSLASTITVLDITGHAKRLMSETFAVIEIFTIAGLLYLAINFVVLMLVKVIEARLSGYRS
jgi:octopine/nopaline transport system permease protein